MRNPVAVAAETNLVIAFRLLGLGHLLREQRRLPHCERVCETAERERE